MTAQKPKTDKPKCGICGKTKRLTRTECCGNWICDDEGDYVPFSYERNSCFRNHRNMTLCGFHYAEEHEGNWKDCPECRKEIGTEMYVWYGTNEYNFEKLENPPQYTPTRCSICGRIIKLGTDNFTKSGHDYQCDTCSEKGPAEMLALDRREAGDADVPGGKVKIGRNDPCPCGSGKKYKRCCYGKQGTEPLPRPEPPDILEELRQIVKEKEFSSLDEAQAFVDGHMNRKNRAPLDDFQGLSAEQMSRFLHFPFSSPDLIVFPERLAAPPDAPIARLFNCLVLAIGEKGLKATVTGNLPLNFVRETALAYLPGEEKGFRPGIRSETEFFDLHVTRLVSGLAGLIRKYRGRFVLTSRCRNLLDKGGLAAVYPLLFQAFVRQYSWAYRDRFPDFKIIQQSFLFSLWLFQRFGDESRYPSFYEDCFLTAFPMILDEAELAGDYMTPERSVRSCYTWRCLEGFAVFFGLIAVEWEKKDTAFRSFRLKKTSLVDEIVTFRV